jgi:hypothetical protein
MVKPANNGWLRLIAALAALMTIASFLDDLGGGRLDWGRPA